MDVKGHLPLGELERLARVEKNADRARRLRIIILGLQGWTAPAVAMAVGLSRRICQRWVARYNAEGLVGLDDRRGQEPGTPLSAEQEAAFRLRVEAGPTDQDLVCSLRGKDFQRILAEEFHVCERCNRGVLHRVVGWWNSECSPDQSRGARCRGEARRRKLIGGRWCASSGGAA